MKIRTDFVTNSSSSSFILAFDDKQDGIDKISAMFEHHGAQYVNQLLSDFKEASPIPFQSILEHCQDDLEDVASFIISFGYGGWWSPEKRTFEDTWMKSHPGATYKDFHQSQEYQDELKRLVVEISSDLIDKIGEHHYLVEVEYEDHDNVGSMLEHDILPSCEFTARRFSHH